MWTHGWLVVVWTSQAVTWALASPWRTLIYCERHSLRYMLARQVTRAWILHRIRTCNFSDAAGQQAGRVPAVGLPQEQRLCSSATHARLQAARVLEAARQRKDEVDAWRGVGGGPYRDVTAQRCHSTA